MFDGGDRIALTMLSGSFEYDSEDSLGILRDYLKENAPALDSTLVVYASEDDDPSLQILDDDTDVLLVFTRRLNAAGTELERFKSYCARGRPIVGLRTASHAYQNWLDFDREVLGGNYDGHYGSGTVTRVEFAPGAESHPILTEVKPFETLGSLAVTLAAGVVMLFVSSRVFRAGLLLYGQRMTLRGVVRAVRQAG